MYVSQIPATIIYTIFKTFLLILLSLIVTSICAYLKKYDASKLFQQGIFTTLYGFINKRYKKNGKIIISLFIIIILETIINFLPTIATTFMPFENRIICNSFSNYFKTNKNGWRIQNVPVVSSNIDMDSYCNAMDLCDNNNYK